MRQDDRVLRSKSSALQSEPVFHVQTRANVQAEADHPVEVPQDKADEVVGPVDPDEEGAAVEVEAVLGAGEDQAGVEAQGAVHQDNELDDWVGGVFCVC